MATESKSFSALAHDSQISWIHRHFISLKSPNGKMEIFLSNKTYYAGRI